MNSTLSPSGRRVALWSAWVVVALLLSSAGGAVFAVVVAVFVANLEAGIVPLRWASILSFGDVLVLIVVVIVLARSHERRRAAIGTPTPT
jgi:hypothetical protein